MIIDTCSDKQLKRHSIFIIVFIFQQEKPRTEEDCWNGIQYGANWKFLRCTNYDGIPGEEGKAGQNGGYAGRSGMVNHKTGSGDKSTLSLILL